MANLVDNLIEYVGIADSNTFPPIFSSTMFFKEFSVQETVCLPCAKPDIEQITKIIAEVKILSVRIVNTPGTAAAPVVSAENQRLTGKKLVVEGEVLQKVEYVADEPTQSVHAAHFAVPFSAFIVIPGDTAPGTRFVVTPYIEDIFAQQIGKRCIFKNITIILIAERP